jgi:hypothetical protein
VAGNLWPALNPWTGLHELLKLKPRLACQASLGQWPAVGLFFAFAWFELVYPAPQDPQRLAAVIAAYWLITFAGMSLFGAQAWLTSVECFSVFFRMVGSLSALNWSETSLRLSWPGAWLSSLASMDRGAAIFVLVALATVSFDGFSRTYTWMDILGLNPLEYPGRSAVVAANTLGLAAMAMGLVALYGLAAAAGRLPFHIFVVSIVPIAFGYHFAHYLPSLPLEAMAALRALSDPLSTGADVLGTAHLAPASRLVTDHDTAILVFRLQTAVIVLAHVMAVAVGHVLALRHMGERKRAILAQLPLTVLMIFYTIFGLWLLSTPVIG